MRYKLLVLLNPLPRHWALQVEKITTLSLYQQQSLSLAHMFFCFFFSVQDEILTFCWYQGTGTSLNCEQVFVRAQCIYSLISCWSTDCKFVADVSITKTLAFSFVNVAAYRTLGCLNNRSFFCAWARTPSLNGTGWVINALFRFLIYLFPSHACSFRWHPNEWTDVRFARGAVRVTAIEVNVIDHTAQWHHGKLVVSL